MARRTKYQTMPPVILVNHFIDVTTQLMNRAANPCCSIEVGNDLGPSSQVGREREKVSGQEEMIGEWADIREEILARMVG